MNEAAFKRLISPENLELAWRRVTTARNFAYKRFSRDVFHIYELAVAENLNDLHHRLAGNSYTPLPPERIFVPKRSGLQRGISLLHVEDQIVYQAVANIVAEKVRVQREEFAGKTVFSNQLSTSAGSIFFLQDWRVGYRQYLDQIKKLHHQGYRWVAQFDLAAFYDTISHELLFRTAFRGLDRSANWVTIESWFEKWANPRETWPLHHGIAQGPLTSDFFAEVFLLPIDKIMGRLHRYVRYVDDIRLFGRTEIEVLNAVRQLEALCRERGLIPQSQKFEVLQTGTVKEALGSLPSLGDPDGDHATNIYGIKKTEAEKIFSVSLGGRPKHIRDKSRARYVLFRAPASTKIRNHVLRLLPRHPEHIDAFTFYLRKFRRTRKLIEICTQSAKKSPFDYVAGELLQLLAQAVRRRADAKPLVDLAVRLAKDKQAGISAKWGAIVFLCKCQELGLGNYSRFVFWQPGFVQALAMRSLPMVTLTDTRAKGFTQRTSVEAGLAFVSRVVSERISLTTAGIDAQHSPSQIQHLLASLGISPRLAGTADPVAELLNKRYGCGANPIWRAVFGGEYGHSVQQLKRAEALYDMGRSEWLNYQNSFNHALFLALQKHLNRLTLPGACKTVGGDGSLVKYGSMLRAPHPFCVAEPAIAAAFGLCNKRRNELPSSHPYDEKTRLRAKPLKKKEQAGLVKNLGPAYQRIIALCLAHGIQN